MFPVVFYTAVRKIDTKREKKTKGIGQDSAEDAERIDNGPEPRE